MKEQRLTVLPEEADLRLDRVLARLVPDMGLRGRRRLCELGLVLVNGHPARESRKMREGEVVSLAFMTPPDEAEAKAALAASSSPAASPADAPAPNAPESPRVPGEAAPLFPEDKPRLIRRTPRFAILYKPA
ncbi:MAG: hypothetical protein IJY48_08340, partial [Mailhella sp.]|nr:hypothetical protein [Mailhella sp.]